MGVMNKLVRLCAVTAPVRTVRLQLSDWLMGVMKTLKLAPPAPNTVILASADTATITQP